jgi:hypothetical protein
VFRRDLIVVSVALVVAACGAPQDDSLPPAANDAPDTTTAPPETTDATTTSIPRSVVDLDVVAAALPPIAPAAVGPDGVQLLEIDSTRFVLQTEITGPLQDEVDLCVQIEDDEPAASAACARTSDVGGLLTFAHAGPGRESGSLVALTDDAVSVDWSQSGCVDHRTIVASDIAFHWCRGVTGSTYRFDAVHDDEVLPFELGIVARPQNTSDDVVVD